jgi:hypothetical protein
MVRGGDRAAAAPVAAKVGADDRKVAGEQRRDGAPHQVCLRETVQQEDWRTGAVRAYEDGCISRLDLGGREVIHHFESCSVPSCPVDGGRSDATRKHHEFNARCIPFSYSSVAIASLSSRSTQRASTLRRGPRSHATSHSLPSGLSGIVGSFVFSMVQCRVGSNGEGIPDRTRNSVTSASIHSTLW